MRRLVPLALAVLLGLSGCGTERPPDVREAAATDPAPPTPVTEPPRLPPGFPLDLGYAATNGDDGSPVTVTSEPATRAFGECGRQVWDPAAGSDVLGVEFRGEAEWARGRTLVLFPTVGAATAAVDTARDAITGCPRDGGGDHGWTEHTAIDYRVGDQSYGWIDRWWTTDVGFGTGLTVYHVVRVGRSVLLTYEYGEGNGSERTRQQAFARAAREDQPVVDEMAQVL